MSNKFGTFVPVTFSQDQLDSDIAAALSNRLQLEVMIERWSFADILNDISEYEALGYVVDTSFTPMAISFGSTLHFQVRLLKPESVLSVERAAITNDVTEAYHTELKNQQADAVEKMTQRILSEAAEKQAKATEAASTKAEQQARLKALEILNIKEVV